MLDVHILTLPSSNKVWLAECVASVEAAAKCAGFPVAIHVVDGIEGDMAASRKLGYSRGTFPYVTHVDDDDWVAPFAFAQLADHLGRVDAIFGAEVEVRGDRIEAATMRKHHLAVYRREIAEAAEPHEWFDRKLALEATGYVMLDHPSYFWRRGHVSHESASRGERA